LRGDAFTDIELNRALRSGAATALFRGVLVSSTASTGFATRCRAALATQHESAAVSHRSAAALLALPWTPGAWSAESAAIQLTVAPEDRHRQRAGLRLRHATLAPFDVQLVNGIRVTTPARTLIDLARDPQESRNRLLVVQLIDGARRRHRCDVDQLMAAVHAAAGLRNVRRADRWLAESRDGVDSPKETQTRLLLLDRQVPYLDVDLQIRDPDGLLRARGDFGDRRLLLWGEYDGYEAHVERGAFRNDRQGDRWLAARGWHVLRIVEEDLRRPDKLARDWLRAREDAPQRIAALDPRRSPEVAAARRALGFDPAIPPVDHCVRNDLTQSSTPMSSLTQ
jgi:hypothetical protein